MFIVMRDQWNLSDANANEGFTFHDKYGNTLIVKQCKYVDKLADIVYFFDILRPDKISPSHASLKKHGSHDIIKHFEDLSSNVSFTGFEANQTILHNVSSISNKCN